MRASRHMRITRVIHELESLSSNETLYKLAWIVRIAVMETWTMDLEDVKRRIIPILRRYGVTRAGIFGSVARGEDVESSDIDILVEIEARMSLLEFAGLKIDLEEALGKKVDVGEYSMIRPLIRERILNEEVPIL